MKSAINFRTTWILLIAAGGLLAALAVYVFLNDDRKPNPQGILLESFHALGVKPADINGLEIDKGNEKLVFTRLADGRWKMMQPAEARANSDLVEAIVQQALTAKRDLKTADVTGNLAAHGLDNPAVKLTLKRGDRSATLSLGKSTIGGESAVVYVLTSDESKKPQAARLNQFSALFKEQGGGGDTASMIRDTDEFRSRKLLGEGMKLEGAPSYLNSVRLTVGKKVVHLARKKPEGVWRFVEPAGWGDVEISIPPDHLRREDKVQFLAYLLNSLLSIEVPSAKDFLPRQRDLTALGLDPGDPDVLRVDIERDDAIGTETLWISRRVAKDQRDKVYVRYEGDPVVAQVNGERPRLLWNFVQDPSDLRDTTLARLRRDRVDAIDVVKDGKTFELRRIGAGWKVFEGDVGYDADARDIDVLLVEISRPRAVRGFPPANAKDAELGFDKPGVELRIWEDGIVDEKVDPKVKPRVKLLPTVRLVFARPPDGAATAYVRRYTGPDHADAIMPRDIYDRATRGRLDYLSVNLKGLAPADVQRVFVPRGSETWEIERIDKDQIFENSLWRMSPVEKKKGDPAARVWRSADPEKVRVLLRTLNQLQKPAKIVAEKPSGPDLALRGLTPDDPKVVKVTLGIQGETPDRVYWFSPPAADKPTVFGRTSVSDFVFETPKEVIEIITGDYSDPHLYRLTAANVKGMKLRGWSESDVNGKPQVLELLRKPGGFWEAKGGTVDSAKVETFLADISAPRAESTTVEKPRPEMGLDVNHGALEVAIDVGEPTPIVLTLGAPTTKGSNLLWATLNRNPGEIYTLRGEKLLPIKEKVGALR